MERKKKKIVKWTQGLIIIYCCIGIAMYYLQDQFLFHPQKLASSYIFKIDGPYEEVNIPVNKEDTINMVKFFPADNVRRGVVIYFHGNMDNIERYAPFTKVFTKKGYEVWMPDYPGYGKSSGRLTEQKLYNLAIQVQRMAMSRYHSDSIIVYGKSMGTGIAAYTASVSQNKMLILESPYYSIPDVFNAYTFIFPTEQIIKTKLPTHDFLADTHIPVTIFCGTADWIIPPRCTKKLKPFLKPGDQFLFIPEADHHDINQKTEYYQALDSLLN